MTAAAKVVLLTGLPNSFLARRLLTRLLEDPSVQIKCVVTDQQHDPTRDIVQQNTAGAHRVELVRGDISAMDFGMAGTRFLALARSIDVIQHCVCATTGGVSRDAEQRTYLGSTGEVLELALAGAGRLQRVVHWSSSLLSEPIQGRVSESALVRPQNFRNTAMQARFQAEQLLRDSMARVPITILRPSLIVGDSQTGESDPGDGLYPLLLMMLSAPADLRLPLPGRGDQPFNLVPVDYVVQAGTAIAEDARSAGKTYQLVDDRPLSVRRVFELVTEATERPAPSGKLPNNLAGVLLRTPGLERFSHIPRAYLEQLEAEVIYDSRNTRELLAGTGIECPNAASYIKLLVEFVKRDQQARIKRKSSRRDPHFEEMVDPLDS
ncbi:MAG TPA: SDR family oxidoreductase [Polyangiales bacterium]|nr:SDR family oxidoreductase [Polyangiales bacterium]